MALLIDTSAIIDAERAQRSPADFLSSLAEPTALAAITAAELLVGVERAWPPTQRQRREAYVESVISLTVVLPYDLVIARIHARLSAQLAAQGQTVGTHDIQIAATAIAHGYAVLTHNLRDFQRIPGLEVQRV